MAIILKLTPNTRAPFPPDQMAVFSSFAIESSMFDVQIFTG
jgi:hypothetical protein